MKYPFDGNKKDPCPEEKTYTKNEVQKMFDKFSKIQIDVEYLFGTGWREINCFVPLFIKKLLGKIWGWHLMIRAIK